MPKIARRLEQAHKRVVDSRHLVSRQRALIEHQKRHGRDTEQFEEILALFERSQVIFEADLDRLQRERRRRL